MLHFEAWCDALFCLSSKESPQTGQVFPRKDYETQKRGSAKEVPFKLMVVGRTRVNLGVLFYRFLSWYLYLLVVLQGHQEDNHHFGGSTHQNDAPMRNPGVLMSFSQPH